MLKIEAAAPVFSMVILLTLAHLIKGHGNFGQSIDRASNFLLLFIFTIRSYYNYI